MGWLKVFFGCICRQQPQPTGQRTHHPVWEAEEQLRANKGKTQTFYWGLKNVYALIKESQCSWNQWKLHLWDHVFNFTWKLSSQKGAVNELCTFVLWDVVKRDGCCFRQKVHFPFSHLHCPVWLWMTQTLRILRCSYYEPYVSAEQEASSRVSVSFKSFNLFLLVNMIAHEHTMSAARYLESWIHFS